MGIKFTVSVNDEDGDGDMEVEVPSKKEVCDRCRGEGSHVNPSIDGNGLTAEDFAEDPDFEESYFAGHYDVQCEECGGVRVVDVIDYEQLNEEQKGWVEQYEKQQQCRAQERAYERRYGGMY